MVMINLSGGHIPKMKHVPETWLRRLNLVYTVFALLILGLHIAGRLLEPLNFLISHAGTSLVSPAIALATLVYSIGALPFVRRYSIWSSYFITYYLTLHICLLAVGVTGGYDSPFFGLVVIFSFFGGMLGVYGAALPVALTALGTLLVLLGVYDQQDSGSMMGATLTVTFITAVAGWLIWRTFMPQTVNNELGLAGQLKKEQLKSDFILNSMNDGVVVVDTSNIISYLNPGASKIIGWSTQDAINLDYRNVLKLCTEERKPYNEEQDPLQKARRAKTHVRDNDAVLETKSGKYVPIVIDTSALLDAEGRDTGSLIAVFRDVSKERDEEARRAEFISTASHEMRTPVAAIEGYLALALNPSVSRVDSNARTYLEKAHSSTQHLGKLFQDLLASAKAEDGRISNHPVVVEMGEYLEKLVEDLKFSAQKKGLYIEYIIGGGHTMIDASSPANAASSKVVKPLYYTLVDPDRIREVITNLFDNAVKYTDTGKITIGLTGDNSIVQFYIRDTGPGIAGEDIPHLFQKFYRVDNSSTRTTGGTGLGLFICRKIIELYNGRIWVESKLGSGSTFYINLPRLSTQKATEILATQPADATPVNQTPGAFLGM